MKTLFFGDLKGQFRIFKNGLFPAMLEVDKIVCMGNLVNCHEDFADKEEIGRNNAILNYWEKVVERVDTVRLMGAHEVMALNFPGKWTNSESTDFLRDNWLGNTPKWFTATEDNGRLVSCGGLTHGEWVSIGRPETAAEAAEKLNEKYEKTLKQGRCLVLDGKPNLAANPIWADSLVEFYPSWIYSGETCPFDQIHTGKSLNTEIGRMIAADEFNPLFFVDYKSYHKFGSVVEVNDAMFRCIDFDLTLNPVDPVLSNLPKGRVFYVENI